MFAVIETGGKQIRVAKGDKIKVEKLPEEEGKNVTFDKVLLFVDGDKVEIGKPELDMSVTGKILKQGKSAKINVLKFKAKKRYKKSQGHRQAFSEVEITNISAAKAAEKAPAKAENEEKKEPVKETKTVKKEATKKPTAKKTTAGKKAPTKKEDK